LEKTLKGSFEREIPGTLGMIFVFRRPVNTSPERIAVKTINREQVKPQYPHSAIDRLTHELRHWVEYRHSPLILPPFFTELVYGWPYIVMPYCDCTLRDYIDEKVQRQGQAEAIALMVQCVAALEYAQRHGLQAHQDLKPENVLLRNLRKGFNLGENYPFIWEAKLADFGLANAYRELGVPWGSRPYLAPEQYELGADLSKVDVFACGVMLHELLTGLHPFGLRTSDVWPDPKPGLSPQWKHENKWKAWASSTKKLDGSTGGQLGDIREIVEKTLRTNPGDRPSLDELRRDLLDTLKRTDSEAHVQLRVLLEGVHFMSLNSSALDVDVDRYQMENLKKLRANQDLPWN
jgi:eukaryotic-like serine/threonine-protein kinase